MAGTKRQRSQSPSSRLYSNKSHKSRVRPSEGHVDLIYGQRSALPCLDADTFDEDDGLDHEDGVDALSYLRSVRQEADGIPPVLRAPTSSKSADANGEYNRDIYENGVGDFRGHYEDGAYYAVPAPSQNDLEFEGLETDTEQDAQLAYFDSILARFSTLRNQLARVPPADLVAQLDTDHPIYLSRLDTKNSRWWRWKMRTVNPMPVQLASMEKGMVLKLLRLVMGGTLLSKGKEVDEKVSRWVWGLLGRLPDRGELSSEEIGVVRELGQKAVMVGIGLRESNDWEEGLEAVEGMLGDGADEAEGIVDSGVPDPVVGEMPKNTDEAIKSVNLAPELLADPVPAATHEEAPDNSEFEALKARMLANLSSSDAENLSAADNAAQPTPTKPQTQPEEETIENTVATTGARSLDQDPEAEKEKKEKEEVEEEDDTTLKWNTRATIDMIITVAGEMYGQRDLLKLREVWV